MPHTATYGKSFRHFRPTDRHPARVVSHSAALSIPSDVTLSYRCRTEARKTQNEKGVERKRNNENNEKGNEKAAMWELSNYT